MALIRSPLPLAVSKAMIAGMPHFLRPGDPPASVLLNVPPDQFYSMRAFTLGLKDVQGPGIRRARLAGWRFLLGVPQFPSVAGVITQTRPDVRPRMTSLFRGPEIADVFQAARQVESLPKVRAKDYLLEMLSIPGLLVEGFWLRSQSGGSDQMVPFYTASKELELMRAYPMEKCMAIMRPLADKFKTFGY